MSKQYRERPRQPICKSSEIQWAAPEQWQDEITGSILFCWPLSSEAQMWEQARCRECNQPARWVGIGSPVNDGEQYFLATDAWCYWCLPREHFTDGELRLVHHAEWARAQTVNQVLEIVRDSRLWTDDKTVELALSQLVDQIREATESRETKLQKRAAWERAYCGPAVEG
jgi:hypothetical protein